MTTAVAMLATINANSKTAPSCRLVLEPAPGMNRTSLQLAPSPWTKRIRAGMLVTNVAMKNQPKIRPVLRVAMRPPLVSMVRIPTRPGRNGIDGPARGRRSESPPAAQHVVERRADPATLPSMDLRLDGKVALVTGASKGIGLAIAAGLASSGASVMLSSRKEDALRSAMATITPTGPSELDVHVANAGDPEAAAGCVAATIERFGAVDILVNNAATNPYMGRTIDIDLPRLDKTYDVNIRGAFVWIQEAWNQYMAEHGGDIINISSIGGLSVETSIGHYNVTKAALIHLTRTLAKELAPKVRINAICPGLVKTDMARALWEENEEAVSKMVPLRRLGEPSDIGSAAVFLASDAASWITGTTLVVDGGMLL